MLNNHRRNTNLHPKQSRIAYSIYAAIMTRLKIHCDSISFRSFPAVCFHFEIVEYPIPPWKFRIFSCVRFNRVCESLKYTHQEISYPSKDMWKTSFIIRSFKIWIRLLFDVVKRIQSCIHGVNQISYERSKRTNRTHWIWSFVCE